MLSKTSNLALQVITEIAATDPDEALTVNEMSKLLGRSVSHIETIVKTLREHGLIVSRKGPGGGYRLAVPAHQLHAGQVCQLFEFKGSPTWAERPTPEGMAATQLTHDIEQVVQEFLNQRYLSEWVVPRPGKTRALDKPKALAFKPMSKPALPKAARSVFEWGQYA